MTVTSEQGHTETKKILKAGEAFGEIALMYETVRTATVTAVDDVTVWSLNGNIFKRIIVQSN